MKNVLYISYDGLTDPLGQSQVLPYLQQLSKEGYCFTILSFEKRERFVKEYPIVKSIVDAAGIVWVPLFFTSKPPVLSKIYDRYRMWQTTLALQLSNKFDMVHCRSYVAAEMGLRLKRKFGIKMLFDMRGFWADEKIDNGQWDLRSPLYKRIYQFYKKKEQDFLLEADGIVSLTQAARDYLLQKPAFRHLSVDVIPCCADLQHFDFNSVSAQAVALKKAALNIAPSAEVMTYLGSVGGWYMTKEMFLFFAEVQKQYPEYVMLILTKDSADMVKAEAASAGIPNNKVIVTYANRQQLPTYLALCTTSVFFIRNTFSKTASSPTKHAELMGMGIPVICNAIGDTGVIIESTKTGLVIRDFTEESFAKAVKTLPELELIDQSYIRQSAQEIFDLQTGVQKYKELYKSIFKAGKVLST